MRNFFYALLGLGFLLIILMGGIFLVSQIWKELKTLDIKVVLAAITAFTTVTVSTLTVVLGKNYERKRELESHYRAKKTEIYDEFLREFFQLFQNDNTESQGPNDEMVNFLREWQRKMVLWGGQDVLMKYVNWMSNLKRGEPDAETLFLMEAFFIEIRNDLGHKNWKVTKGTFVHLILRDADIFLEKVKRNPKLKLSELEDERNEP